ncbi:hypothetical protein [Rubrivirga sp.]|uniref:hypothetical protein n=1 Tax=Rubrivirga sp. TaxID=1885344 RepID=UPI003B526194
MADAFGRRTAGHHHPDGYRVIGADVPLDVAATFYRWPMLDGVGAARFAPASDVGACTVRFLPLT